MIPSSERAVFVKQQRRPHGVDERAVNVENIYGTLLVAPSSLTQHRNCFAGSVAKRKPNLQNTFFVVWYVWNPLFTNVISNSVRIIAQIKKRPVVF